MQRTNRLLKNASLASAFGVLAMIGGCSALQTPQQACVAPETTEAIAGLLTSGAAEGTLDAALLTEKMPDLKTLPDVVQGLWKRGLISIDEITLKSVDKDTKVIRCTGVLKMNLKAGVRDAPTRPSIGAVAGDEADVPITYERQPEANGAHYVYRINAVGDYRTTLLLMAASQGAPPAPAATTPAMPPPENVAQNVASSDPVATGADGTQPASSKKVVQITSTGPDEFIAPAVQVHCVFDRANHSTALECAGPNYKVYCDTWVGCRPMKMSGDADDLLSVSSGDDTSPMMGTAGMRFTMGGDPECTIRTAEVACSISGIDQPGQSSAGFVAKADGARLFSRK